MATVATLRAKVAEIVQDASLMGGVLGLLNRGLLEVAGRVRLPDLDASDTVATVTEGPSVALPSDYHQHLYWVGSASQERRIDKLYQSFTTFLRRYPDPALDASGDINAVAIKGKTLYYQPIPTSPDTLTLHYFRTPAVLDSDDDIPEGIPAHLHEALLVHFVCRELFAEIEDGIEGQKVNTAYHDSQYERAIADLHRFVISHGEPQYIRDEEESIYGW